jgi:pilus assembly protein CpaB
MRAMAIEVSASSMVGGFIGPGDYVDVLLTYRESVKSDDNDPRIKSLIELNLDKVATETILQNVKILAVDQSAKRSEEDKVKVAKTVTLAVSARDAEKLALSQDMGTLNLALRAPGDDKIVQKTWPTTSDARLITVDDEIFRQSNVLKKDAGINPDIVRIYSGSQSSAVPTPPANPPQ